MNKKNQNKRSDIPAEGSYQKSRTGAENHNKYLFWLLILLIGVSPGFLNVSFDAEENYDLGSYYMGVSSLVRYIGNFEYPHINPDLHFGFFNAYYPLAFFIPSIIALVSGNIFFAISLSRILVSLFSALSFYTVCKYEKIDASSGLVLTFLYVFSAYYLSLLKGNISWAGAFIFTPLCLYSLYKVFYGEKRFEILLVVSFVGLILISLAPFIYITYFFMIYIIFLIFAGKKFHDIFEGIKNLIIPIIFVLGISSFYLFFISTAGNEMAFDKLLATPGFSGKPEMFIQRGIDFKSVFYITESSSTTIGFIPFILFLSGIILRPFSKISNFERYLILMLFLSILVSVFPISFAYFPKVGNTEFGFRALVIGAFSVVLLGGYAISNLVKKRPYFAVIGIIILGALFQFYFTPESVYKNERAVYSKDMKEFNSFIQTERGTVRVNYPLALFYPMCDNCIAFGAPVNMYAITRDEPTTKLWGYIDFAQRNPADLNISGLLGEKYVIVQNELAPQYLENGYMLEKKGEKITLLKNPAFTSIMQFVTDESSSNLEVERKGSVFSTRFKAEKEGILLVKFAYHPLAEIIDNGKKVEAVETDYGIMYVELKSGGHEIVFHYRNYNYYYLTIASIILLLFYYRKNLTKLWIR